MLANIHSKEHIIVQTHLSRVRLHLDHVFLHLYHFIIQCIYLRLQDDTLFGLIDRSMSIE